MSKATKEQLEQVLADIKAQGYDLAIDSDKTEIYEHIANSGSAYVLEDGVIISNISIKYLFFMFNNAKPLTRLAKKK